MPAPHRLAVCDRQPFHLRVHANDVPLTVTHIEHELPLGDRLALTFGHVPVDLMRIVYLLTTRCHLITDTALFDQQCEHTRGKAG